MVIVGRISLVDHPTAVPDEMWVKGKLSGKNKDRVKAREMHGVFSEGLFYGSRYFVVEFGEKVYIDSPRWNPAWVEGQDVANEVGVLESGPPST